MDPDEALPDDALLTAAQAAAKLGDVSRQLIHYWRTQGLKVRGRCGRSPLYRWGDLQELECQMRQSRYSYRGVPRRRAA